MKSYSSTLRYLYGLQDRGMKFGLRNVAALLRELGNPECRFASIHVAGTNGKGSTAAFLASAFMEAGYRTGLYTSPHLIRFTERIRINGREIPEEWLVRYVRRLRPTIESLHATFFEATTCVAFQYFADEQVDIAILEAGLGGRLDATNVVTPLISVITNVGFDHMGHLGNTIRSIAREKAGIIKPGVPVVTASVDPAVRSVLRRTAAKQGAPFRRSQKLVRMRRWPNGRDGLRCSFSSRSLTLRNVRLGLSGDHQAKNAQLAVAALDLLRRGSVSGRRFRRMTARTIARGLANVRMNTGLRGRMEWIVRKRPIVVDVAHNPDGVYTLVRSLRSAGVRKAVVIIGVMKDKDFRGMLRGISTLAEKVIAVAPATKRALRVPALSGAARALGIEAVEGGSVRRGVRIVLGPGRGSGCPNELAVSRSPVVITGSHYVAGEALRELEAEKA